MKVLVLARPVQGDLPGGDKVHAEKTVDALRGLSVDVEFSETWAPELAPYDVIHLFNVGNEHLAEPMLRHALRARALRRPVVLTPIYWDLRELREHFGGVDPRQDRRERALQGLVLRLADRVLPNSRGEADVLEAAFPEVRSRVRVVPAGVESRWSNGDARRFCERTGLEERAFVMCAARVEPRKNQHVLIELCGELGLPLVLAGAEYNAGYSQLCREAAAASGAQVEFVPHLAPGELANAYAAARVHVLPSWLESVGFASVEAAVAGCNVVTTAASGADEYFGEDAWYCDPASKESIKAAIQAAYQAPLRPEVGRTLAERFSWQHVATQTLVAYREAVAEHSERGSADGWTPPISPVEYAEYVEDLLHVQLETIALRDAQFAALQEVVDGTARGPHEQDQRATTVEGRLNELEKRNRSLEGERSNLEARVSSLEKELDAIYATKLFRYTASLRRLYGRVPRRRPSAADAHEG